MADPRIAVFLGAGASKAEGAPLQGELFRSYFEYARGEHIYGYQIDIVRELASFFRTFFGIDFDHDDLTKATFPTFEEALGMLELAISRDESFKGYDNANLSGQGSRIRNIREALILLIAVILQHSLANTRGLHNRLVQKLLDKKVLRNFDFISFNYDILIDNAFVSQYETVDLDYCLEFTNFTREKNWHRPDPTRAVRLLKLHGSLNWLYCPTCRTIKLTPKEKGICWLVTDPASCTCLCGTMSVPIIIPPTYFKILSNLFLQEVWNAAEKILSDAEIWVLCGYSFPDADMHVKYLLKRVQVNSSKLRKVIVFNSHLKKDPLEANGERRTPSIATLFGIKV